MPASISQTTDATIPAEPTRAPAPSDHPATLGGYTILRKLGEGGMGAVYEARQDKPRRTVALKVIRPGYLSAGLLRRFDLESQVLARLQHPGIAQVYEAGTATGGTALQAGDAPAPFFAMEFIRGATLTEHARANSLDHNALLRLVARICDAVQHAHQRGVIHRDLKPANILVDDTGQPKILDFGIARVTESDVQATLQTDPGQIVGTLPYMSPEQAAGDPGELDTRADVYALGVITYELLAGRLPHDLKGKPLAEALRTIREDEPATLSTAGRTLRGDVETIVCKALEKDKARRYQSAADLGADIERYLQHKPIAARPATTVYQLRKFARRHRALVTGVAAAFIALVLGLVGTAWQALMATRARDATRASFAESSVREALLARQRGQWNLVIEALDRALELRTDRATDLRLLRVEAIASLDPARVDAELAALERSLDGPEVRGAIELWRAEPRVSRQGDPALLAQGARKAMELGLPPADDLYARAIVAETVPESIGLLKDALGLDPYHVRANALLTFLYVMVGDFVNAEVRTSAWIAREPTDVTALTMRVHVLLTMGRTRETHEAITMLEGRIDPAFIKRFRQGADSIHIADFERLDVEPWRAGDVTATTVGLFSAKSAGYGELGSSQGTGLPPSPGLTPAMQNALNAQLRIAAVSAFGQWDAAWRAARESYRLAPGCHTGLPLLHVLCRERGKGEAAEVARQVSSVITPDFIGYRSFLYFAMRAVAFGLSEAPAGTDVASQRRIATDYATRLLATGPLNPRWASFTLILCVHIQAEWLIPLVIERWHQWKPDDPETPLRSAKFRMAAGDPVSALFLAATGLRDSPGHTELTELRDRALSQCRHRSSTTVRALTLAGFKLGSEVPGHPAQALP